MTDRSIVSRRAALAVAALSLAACGTDSPTGDAPVATSIQVVTQPAANVAAGMPLVAAPTFVVRDQRGNAMSGVPVAITVVAGGGAIANAPSASGGGATSVGDWTLGQTVGVNRLEIAVPNVRPETLTATSVAGAPSAITVVNNDQAALAGRVTPAPVRFVLRDQFGNPVPGRTLAVAVAAGGGELAGVAFGQAATLTTGADGAATVPTWTLGKIVRPQRLVASLVGGTLLDSARASVETGFDVDVRFIGAQPVPAVRDAFADAVARIRAIVIGDLASVNTGLLNLASECGNPALPTAFDEVVDDVVIFAQIEPIDGVGRVLGRAGACFARGTTTIGLPFIGLMQFDSADLQAMIVNGTITDVMMHEMMHVLGFSSFFFTEFGIATGVNTPEVAFTGANATRACREAGAVTTCASSVPLENTGGAGTANSHWRETTFDTEIMTGFINGIMRPFSSMTVGAFEDMGYTVNYDAKEPYTTASSLMAATSSRALASLHAAEGWEEVLPVRVVMSPNGRARRRIPVAP